MCINKIDIGKYFKNINSEMNDRMLKQHIIRMIIYVNHVT